MIGSKIEKNYYELLKATPDMSDTEIEAAYNQAKAMYGKDSVAFYSLFSNEQREAMLAEIADAYNVLKDPVKRKAYDEKSGASTQGSQTAKKPDLSHLYETKSQTSRHGTQVLTWRKPLPSMNEDDPMTAEQYRILYTKLEQISSHNSYKCFAVTSSVKGEGKTSTSVSMAWLISHEFRKKVVLLEGDLKNPSLSSYFVSGLPKPGLIDVVKGSVELKDAIVQVEDSRLYILPAGGRIRNSSEVLSSNRMNRVLSALKEEFDILIIDSPPILSLADMNIMSKLVDGLLLVVRAGETPKDVVLKAVKSISNAKIIGMILNGAERSNKKYERYYYY